MLTPPACHAGGTSEQWLQFTRWAGEVLTHPAGLILGLVGLGVILGINLRRQQRWRWAMWAAMGLIMAMLFLPVMTTVALVALIPPDTGQAADAVVILGRGAELRSLRTAVAADLVMANRAQTIFVSGGGDAPEMIDILKQDYGVTAPVEGENCSRTTQENAVYTAQLLLPQGVNRIILVTDAPHMLRSHLTFRNVGFNVISHPSPFPKGFGLRHRLVIACRETAGFITYGLLGRF